MKAARPTIALVSQVWTGHIPAYHRAYARALAAQGVDVREVVFGATKPAASEGSTSSPAKSRPVILRQIARSGMLRSLRWWVRIAGAIRRIEQSTGQPVAGVVFTYLDLDLLNSRLPAWIVGLVLRRPWAGIVVHPRGAYGIGGTFPQGERVLAAKYCRAVVVIDESFFSLGRAAWPGRAVIVAPDLADVSVPDANHSMATAIRTWAGGGSVVGLLGAITAKKNVAWFIALARAAAAAGDNTRFVIAGLLSSRVAGETDYEQHRELLRSLPDNCRAWVDGLAEGAEFNAAVSACDVVFIAYRPEPENSNVLTKAAYFRKPVLVSEGHLMADAVRAANLGLVVRVGDDVEGLAALRRLLVEDQERDFAGHYARHSEERLAAVAEQLCHALLAR